MDNQQKKIATLRLTESIIDMLAASERKDPKYVSLFNSFEKIVFLFIDLGIFTRDEIEDIRTSLSHQWQEEMKTYSISTLGLVPALRKYREYGGSVRCGDWSMLQGGPKFSWEIRYRENTFIVCDRNLEFGQYSRSFNTIKISDKALFHIYEIIEKEYPECKFSGIVD